MAKRKAWEHHGRESKQARGLGGRWECYTRPGVLKRDGYLCQVCLAKGIIREATAVHHLVARADGGTDDWSNLQSICEECHMRLTMAAQGKSYNPPRGCDIYGNPLPPGRRR